MAQEEMWTNDGPPIYLDAAKIRVVEAESPDAAFLLVAEGGQIPKSTAKQYGLTEKPPEAEQLALPEVELPEAEQPEVELPEAEQPEVELPEAEQPEVEQPEVEPRKGKPAPNTKLRETPDNKSGQG